MKLFNFFKKFNLPSSYEGLISPADYQTVLKIARKYHEENGLQIQKIEDGELIIVDKDGEEQHRYLDNLVRLLPPDRKEIWPRIIYEHFDKLKSHVSAYKYMLKDFEYASPLLRVLIKADDVHADNLTGFVHRTDFPGTHTFLVIEFEQQFRYLTTEEIKEWEEPVGELFEIAISNTPEDEVKIKEYQCREKFLVYGFISGDYSASMMLDLDDLDEAFTGTYGSVIAIPSKGTAFVHPVESGDIMELVEALMPTVEEFNQKDPGNITTRFYWRYKGSIQAFPIVQDAGNTYYMRLPDELRELVGG